MAQGQMKGIHSIFYNLSRDFAHRLHCFEATHLLRRGTRKRSKRNERDASIFDNISGDFAHKLYFFKVWNYLEEEL
jgi:hypothetical protein